MRQTLFLLLTNEGLRHTSEVQASLDKECAVGAPWFDLHQHDTLGEASS